MDVTIETVNGEVLNGNKAVALTKEKWYERIVVKTLGFIFGVPLVLLGALLCVTIIGIPIGVGMVFTGGFMSLGVFAQKTDIRCPECDKKIKMIGYHDSKECPRCKVNIPLVWTDKHGKKIR
ncbi:phage FluMu protein Com [Virgibacillus halotolerans]|uniref:DUF2614 family zinc ribbon-containing protein n=1 Tax=Virgibacillus halotolerans TaxID=1071053 RepID=UPI001960DB48|nr:DUF2614 family zinc ribbon-containing protein [Virgibacillus halotolerans]MBM7600493.1 phage FluMu protein Com [Virgibacillus halotolerans]